MITSSSKIILLFCLACCIGCNTNDPKFITENIPPTPSAIEQNPSSEFLSPAESMKTMHLPKGYHLQLVASEPEIQEPVAIVWDGNGRMYVAEMRSYMQDIDGTGEQLPTCRVTQLEDIDGDGKMDKHSIFIDSLVLPRMMLMLDNRLVVNETNSYNLFAYVDTDNDGKADQKKLIYQNDGRDNNNLEHQRSGLIWNIDNYIYTTSSPARYRYADDKLVADSIYGTSGQWGLAHDDYGRLFFSSAGGEIPALDFQQNPAYGRLGIDGELENDFESVWPVIATPDVQGGKIRQRADSSLNHFTASCGQTVYRGDRLPINVKGDLFICEPVGRLIRRAKVTNRNGTTYLRNAYEKSEFITSSDMNFRPVNMETGPDGCLYIVDMYHGIIQESAWVTSDSYLRPQVLKKGLQKNINRGRIYRVVHDGYEPGPKPQLLNDNNKTLVSYLSHPNGWWRDNAQKLLIIHNDNSIVPSIKEIVLYKPGPWANLSFWKTRPTPIGKLHALWTLEGLQAIDKSLLENIYSDPDPEMRKAAIKISEPFLIRNDKEIFSSLEKLKSDTSADVKIQLALSLRFSKNEKAKNILQALSSNNQNQLLSIAVKESLQEEDPALKQLRSATAQMDEEDKNLVFTGAAEFGKLCATCHGMDGKGLPSKLAPPLSGSSRVNGDKQILVSILLNGLSGPVDNYNYPDVMPPLKANNDEYIASVASYIRNSLGNKAKVILPEDVQQAREKNTARTKAWTLKELIK